MTKDSEEQRAPVRSIGKYEVTGILGRGSMGVVYKARDPEIGRTVAVKTLRKLTLSSDEERVKALERFSVEARSAGNLRHPNIITVFDVSIEGDLPYIVMDYVEGESLDQIILKHNFLSPPLALYYLGQVAAAVDAAHQQGVIHRDLKPSNIIVDRNESCYVVDFGVAKIQESITSEETETDEPVMGTPGYMSPEQILNKPLDHRTDLFSLAVVAFECFTGRRPFVGKNFTEVLTNILNGEPLSISELSSLPLTLEAEFERAFAKERDERFGSATQMIRGFQNALGFGRSEFGESDVKELEHRGPIRERKPSEWVNISAPIGETQVSTQFDSESELNFSQKGVSSENTPLSKAGSEKNGFDPEVDAMEEYDETVEEASGFGPLIIAFVAAGCIVVGATAMWFLSFQKNDPGSPVEPHGSIVAVQESMPSDREPDGATSEGKVLGPSVPGDRFDVVLDGRREEDEVLSAIVEMGRVRDERFVSLADKLLRDDSYRVRIETIKSLALIGGDLAASKLISALDDHDPLVRGHSVNALGSVGNGDTISILLERYQREKNETVQAVMKRTIKRLRDKQN